MLSCSVLSQLFATPWTVAHQAPLSMECSRQEYWSGLPLPSPGDLPNPGIEPASVESPALQADCLPLSHLGSPFSGHYLNPSLAPVTFQRILYFTCCLIYDPYMSAPWVQGVLSAGRGRARDWGLRSRRQGSLLWDCNAPLSCRGAHGSYRWQWSLREAPYSLPLARTLEGQVPQG